MHEALTVLFCMSNKKIIPFTFHAALYTKRFQTELIISVWILSVHQAVLILRSALDQIVFLGKHTILQSWEEE